MMDLVWLIVVGLFGAVLGALLCYLLTRGKSTNNNVGVEQEFEQYREKVADHFADTAKLVNRMTDSYKGVFEHLQQGADELIDPEQLRIRLADENQEAITLNRLGYKQVNTGQKKPVTQKPSEPAPKAESKVETQKPKAESDDKPEDTPKSQTESVEQAPTKETTEPEQPQSSDTNDAPRS